MTKQKRAIVFILIGMLVAVLCVSACYLYLTKTIYLDFEYVTEIDIVEKQDEYQPFPWMTVIDESFNPSFNKEYLSDLYGEEIFEHEDFSDTDQYTYIVTFGRKLNLIAYKPFEARTKYLGIIPKQYLGKVSLSDETDSEKIYVYRTKRINLVQDEYGTDYYL
ncbi:MAG: hypothetical protein ACI4F5_06035 [Acutalibacteraceae bacterium]